MKKKFNSFLKLFGLLLFLGLCMTVLSKEVKANAATTDMRLNVSEVSIAKDSSFRLRAYNIPSKARIIYRSSDNSVAYVDSRGYITGLSNGECIISATVIEKGSAVTTLQCNVVIGPAAISIKLTKTELIMRVGMKKTLKTIVSPLNTVEKPVFFSADKQIAFVSSIGRVKAKDTGIVDVFAILENGQSAECRVYVLNDEDYAQYLETGTLEGIIPDYVPVEIENPDNPEEDDTDVSENNDTSAVDTASGSTSEKLNRQ